MDGRKVIARPENTSGELKIKKKKKKKKKSLSFAVLTL